jgi:nickel/cobalt transporter (NicO) family protein
MFTDLVNFQREIYLALADQIKAVADGAGWAGFIAFLPMGIVFGAAHALTPGHSKAVLATYLAGSDASIGRGLLTAITLSATHVTMALLIAILSLPLVSIALGSVGRAPMLEDISRALLGVIGLWMIWRALMGSRHHAHEGEVVGFMAGLVPCPLTLFVMTFAISRGVPGAGVLFAGMMILGVALTLGAVALISVVLRDQVLQLIASRPRLIAAITRTIEGVAGTVLAAIAAIEIFLR